MAFSEILAACKAAGLTCDEAAGTVSGVRQGVAFRITVPTGKVELSINIREALLPKLLGALSAYGTFVPAEGNGVCFASPTLSPMDGEAFLGFLDTALSRAVALAGDSFDDTFEKDGESPLAYLRGILGALVGALVGILPWFLGENLLHFSFWYLGALVSIASFFGYRYLWGAHSTRFAFTVIAVCSILAMGLSQAATAVWSVLEWVETVNTVGDAMAYIMATSGLGGFFSDGLFGILACAVGLVGLRNRILLYTHESNYLRRGRKRK